MPSPLSLHAILSQPHSPDYLVCQYPDRTWGELLDLVAGLVAQLPGGSPQRWLLNLESPFDFTAALLACWHRGHVPIILPDHLPGTLAQAVKFGEGYFLKPTQKALNLPTAVLSKGNRQNLHFVTRQPQDIALELFTSGSTGERKRIAKSFFQLESEIGVLESTLGIGPGLRMATVSHLHIYGLLFRVLWPLSTKSPFSNTTYLFWEPLLSKLNSHETVALISSPAHLKHLAAIPEVNAEPTRLQIFSSGGPLPRSVALDIRERLGVAPTEVLGSTETGGIAWRQQSPEEDSPWQPFPGVEVSAPSEALEVRSPFLPNPEIPYVTGDRVLFLDKGRFFLKGRLDRIVKLAEKRVSLTEMETHLANHPLVDQVKLLVLPHQTDTQRDFLGCVIQLNIPGLTMLFRKGKANLIQIFRQALKPHFEAVTLPRQWRFPAVIPTDSQSKTPISVLIDLFKNKLHERPQFPELLSRTCEAGQYHYQLKVPENLLHFEGHFKQVAVVAGVVQLQWIFQIIAMETGTPLHVERLEVIKFHKLLMPNDTFEMDLSYNQKSGKWVYRLTTGDHKFASGRIIPQSSPSTESISS